jgi:lipopolysaccharide transport system ATP-binding protein
LKPIIEVNHVWKEYQKGIDRRYKSLRDTLVGMPNRLFGTEKKKFWALEDIDFKVEAGESVGIIGRNGAGKSTLLKILSRITPPTKGEIILRGRVASLLEVGTGFHPELTGRENVFFNGSILGMKHAEIKRKFDEIVDFSGVESFIDTPLKHYSSGMQMRLAFSVAAHLDSEILLIDEVLAVGDAEFQKKCIGKMDDVSKGEGKTILFVSHDLSILSRICVKSILVNLGQINSFDSTNKVISTYLNTNNLSNIEINETTKRKGNGKLKFTKIEVKSKSDPINNIIKSGDDVIIKAYFESEFDNFPNFLFAIGIDNIVGQRISILSNEMINKQLAPRKENKYFEIEIFKISLANGTYSLNIYCSSNDQVLDWIKNVCTFDILNGDYYSTGTNLPNHSVNSLLKFKLSVC